MSRRKAENAVKNAVTAMIKSISIIAIFVSLAIILLLYLGPEINLTTGIVFRLAVPSVVLSISAVMVYELWVKNGRQNAYEEIEYRDLLKEYALKSENLHYPTAQEFLDYEYERRYQVEKDSLTRKLHRELELLAKIETVINQQKINRRKRTLRDRWEYFTCKREVRLLTKELNTIRVSMPYEKSEEFDYLRYNLQDIVYKEYSPNDTKKHLAKARVSKYSKILTFTIFGLNALSIGGSMGDIWVAIIMTALASATLVTSVVQGFSVGYQNIKVISTGVYKTAVSFLDQAVAYCKREGKDLYYKGPTDFRLVSKQEPIVQVPVITVKPEEDIFTKASKEVTQSSIS